MTRLKKLANTQRLELNAFSSPSSTSSTWSTEPPPATPVNGETHVYVGVGVSGGGHSGGGHGGGGHGGKLPSGTAAGKSEDAWALFIVAAAIGVTLAFTEGARYDGFVKLHPMHPVHLYGPGGYLVLPLAQIDPDTAAWADKAVIRDSEGPWQPRGRAPLDRTGFTYQVLVGGGQLRSGDGSLEFGTAGHVALGFHANQQLGFQIDWGFSFRNNSVADRVFDSRWSLDLEFLPLDAGAIHAGVFGQAGIGSRYEDGYFGGRDDYLMLSGGAVGQLELTTRLALTARLGIAADTREIVAGVSIY